MAVTDTLRELREQVEQNLSEMKDTAALDALRVKVLGKKGTLTELLKGMGKLAPEERPKVGAQINEARQWLTERMNERQEALQKLEREATLKAETIDVTEPRRPVKVGSSHPITLVMDELIDCFTGLGFEVMEGPEVELDHYNFELMNLPKNHPARDAQDTFYMDDNIVLRTHTSPMQARAMLTRYGMSDEFDMVALETVNNQYLGGDTSLACSAQTQREIDQKVVELVKAQHEKAVRILTDNRAKLDELAQYLYQKETITGEEFMEILNREPAQAQ